MAKMIYAGEFATESERRAANILATLPDEWIVICNKTLPIHGRTSEIDFIVIGFHLVFILDEKSWNGTISGSDQTWVFADGSSITSPLNKIDFVARPLAGHLRAKIPTLNLSYFVHAGILLTNAQQFPRVKDPRMQKQVFLGQTVVERLIQLDQQQSTKISSTHRLALEKSFYDLGDRPANPTMIQDYQILESSVGPGGIKIFQATFRQQSRLLMVYDLTKVQNQAELTAFFDREYTALANLKETGVVAEVHDPILWSEHFQVIPITPPKGKTLAAIAFPESRDDFAKELTRASICFSALAQIHQHQVIHRAINPSAITIQELRSQPQPRAVFSNFFAARIDDQSIAYQLDQIDLTDAYAHPTLKLSYAYATQATDRYSLALVFLERLSACSINDLRNYATEVNQKPINIPNLYHRWSSVELAIIEELTQIFESLLNGDLTNTRDSQGISKIFSDLADRTLLSDEQSLMKLDNRYQVERLLGRGATAQTFLVKDLEFPTTGLIAAKQFFNAADVWQAVQNEFNALKQVTSRYLPKVFDIFPATKQIHLKMEYIPGQNLEELQTEFPWDLDAWWKLADHMLSALEELEDQRLLHRDIKLANIILDTERSRFVLIDFGFALSNSEAAGFAGTPLYWPPEILTSNTIPKSIDRYALAIILFRVLTGKNSFIDSKKQDIEKIIYTNQRQQNIIDVLAKALSYNPDERPQSARIFREQVTNALRVFDTTPETRNDLVPQINPWVSDIRSLIRTSVGGNANNRGLDSDFVLKTYVPTNLDEKLLPDILNQKPKIVFLSGNPGDGKTAFLEQVKRELSRLQAQKIYDDPSGWEYQLNGHHFRSCYDASESHGDLSADQQLMQKLSGLEGRSFQTNQLTVLVAINDGRLVDFLDRHGQTFSAIKQAVDYAYKHSLQVDQAVWVIDLKRRAFINLDSEAISIAREVLDKLINIEDWQICNQCSAQLRCPIKINAQSLRHKRIAARLEYLLLIAHLRRQRHITMRDLRSSFALLITGNNVCSDIHSLMNSEDSLEAFQNITFWQSIFTTDNGTDELLGDLAILDPARQSYPQLDRFLHYHQVSNDLEFYKLFLDAHQSDRTHFIEEKAWIGAVKRRLYFSAEDLNRPIVSEPMVTVNRFLPYRYAEQYIAILAEKINCSDFLEIIARGFLRSDGLPLFATSQKLSLRISFSEQQQLAVVKQFPIDQFVLEVSQSVNQTTIESIPEILIFKHRQGYPRLEITLELFELLLRLADGADPYSDEYKPLLEELAPFKSALLLRETNELVLIEMNQRIHTIKQQNQTLILENLTQGGNV
ncbi:protein kinase domain-containing protein [Herpetosiphon llansteffanensis]|uniref:protein kinase domain-containing protein n=1 Tax=Herpetosiphon llansteffanensis TaxID=2094568 RepID=UPI0013DEA001|nr:protein kinase [Herpetosiphon llansteffanensis]